MAMKRMLRRQVNSQDELVFHFPLHDMYSTGSPQWENDNEFSLHGKMYDVIEKREENGRLIVRCISDEKEMELIKKFQKVLEKQFGNSAKKRSASLLQLITAPFTIPTTFIPSSLMLTLHNEFAILRCSIHAACRDVITPPPRFL